MNFKNIKENIGFLSCLITIFTFIPGYITIEWFREYFCQIALAVLFFFILFIMFWLRKLKKEIVELSETLSKYKMGNIENETKDIDVNAQRQRFIVLLKNLGDRQKEVLGWYVQERNDCIFQKTGPSIASLEHDKFLIKIPHPLVPKAGAYYKLNPYAKDLVYEHFENEAKKTVLKARE